MCVYMCKLMLVCAERGGERAGENGRGGGLGLGVRQVDGKREERKEVPRPSTKNKSMRSLEIFCLYAAC